MQGRDQQGSYRADGKDHAAAPCSRRQRLRIEADQWIFVF
jgi:hypothetical protein